MSTLKRRLVSIGVIHRLKGHYLDTKHPSIIENIMGIKRRKGSIQKGKKPILISNLKSIINVIDQQDKEEIKKIRDRTIILIGFSGGFRRNEIVSLDYDDLDFVDEGLKIASLKLIIDAIDQQNKQEIKKFRDRSIILIGFSGGFRRNEIVSLDHDDLDFVPEGLKINLRRSKTDQFGEGTIKALPYFDNHQYCPVVSIKKWLNITKLNSGPLFRRFSKSLKLSENRLTDQTVALLVKEYLELAGINSKNYSAL